MFCRYVLSTTHLHEFKSPDRIASQAPVMSLALEDQKLGSHSNADSTSHKFMLKGRQSGGIHRGHAWVFRAESYDTMLAWFSDIKNLTEKTGAERNAFIQRSHARSLSAGSHKPGSISSDGLEEDEADQIPYSATPSSAQQEKLPGRPNPGGRFPSALNVDRDSQMPLSPSSNESTGDHELIAAPDALPNSEVPVSKSGEQVQAGDDTTTIARRDLGMVSGPLPHKDAYSALQESSSIPSQQASNLKAGEGTEYSNSPAQAFGKRSEQSGGVVYIEDVASHRSLPHHVVRHDSKYGDWMGSAITNAGGGTIGREAYRYQNDGKNALIQNEQLESQPVEPQGAARKTVGIPVQGAIFAAIAPTTATTNSSTANAGQNGPAAAPASISHMNDPTASAEAFAEAAERPSLGGRSNTISDLHLPGEYPRGK